MGRYARKVDTNQKEIVEALRKIPGVSVDLQHNDILVGFRGVTYWYEIKNPDCVGKDGKVRQSEIEPSQKKLLEEWKGHYEIVWNLDQILKEIGINT